MIKEVFIKNTKNASKSLFSRFSNAISTAAGKPITFISAVLAIIFWAASGPVFGFSDTWQLVINTGTTIVTFLMVFLIQNTQNRDTFASQLKLDELILSIKNARNEMLDIEDRDEKDLFSIRQEMVDAAESAKGNDNRAGQPKRESSMRSND